MIYFKEVIYMNTLIVRNRNDLKEAVEKGYDEIILEGKLAEKFEKAEKIQKLSQPKLASLIAFASGAGATIIASLVISAESSGISLAFSATTVTVFAAAEGINIAVVAEYLMLCALVGTKIVKNLIEKYDIELKNKDGQDIPIVELKKI